MSEHETPEEKANRLQVEESCLIVGRTIKEFLPENLGFTLLVFDIGNKGTTAYMSSVRREDTIKAMREFLDKLQ